MEAVLAVVLVLVALVAVVVVVVALAASRSRKGEGSAEIEQLRTQLELQSAELRRLADGQRAYEGGEDRLKAGIEEARRAIGELSVREQERRVREDESGWKPSAAWIACSPEGRRRGERARTCCPSSSRTCRPTC